MLEKFALQELQLILKDISCNINSDCLKIPKLCQLSFLGYRAILKKKYLPYLNRTSLLVLNYNKNNSILYFQVFYMDFA